MKKIISILCVLVVLFAVGCVSPDENNDELCKYVISTEPLNVTEVEGVTYMVPYTETDLWDTNYMYFSHTGNGSDMVCKETGEIFDFNDKTELARQIKTCPTCTGWYSEALKQIGLSKENPYIVVEQGMMYGRLLDINGVQIIEVGITKEGYSTYHEMLLRAYNLYKLNPLYQNMTYNEFLNMEGNEISIIYTQFPAFLFCTNDVAKYAKEQQTARNFIEKYISVQVRKC